MSIDKNVKISTKKEIKIDISVIQEVLYLLLAINNCKFGNPSKFSNKYEDISKIADMYLEILMQEEDYLDVLLQVDSTFGVDLFRINELLTNLLTNDLLNFDGKYFAISTKGVGLLSNYNNLKSELQKLDDDFSTFINNMDLYTKKSIDTKIDSGLLELDYDKTYSKQFEYFPSILFGEVYASISEEKEKQYNQKDKEKTITEEENNEDQTSFSLIDLENQDINEIFNVVEETEDDPLGNFQNLEILYKYSLKSNEIKKRYSKILKYLLVELFKLKRFQELRDVVFKISNMINQMKSKIPEDFFNKINKQIEIVITDINDLIDNIEIALSH
ncbi:MAG: hypothetical protein ACTSRZ_08325 [Promethearchaeota archaeon]